MNEYTKVRNAYDRAVILARLVNADARVLAAAMMGESAGEIQRLNAASSFKESRAELWKLIGPAEEAEAAA